MKVFASIYIGSYEIILKVFEVSKNKQVKEIDCLRTWCDISKDISETGSIQNATLNRLLGILKDMKQTIKTYKCNQYEVYGGYVFGGAKNIRVILDQIYLHENLRILLLSNSEQRFLSYLALASTPDFENIISESALVVDIGGSSIQITLFEKGTIVTTEHILLGAITIRDHLVRLKDKKDANSLISEIIKKEFSTFSNIYLKDMKLKYLVLINDQIHNVANKLPSKSKDHVVSKDEYATVLNKLKKKQIYSVISETFEFESENEMLMPFILLYQNLIDIIKTEQIMIPGVSVSEGIAYKYAYETKVLKAVHDFDEDILSASWAIAKRYDSYLPHLKALESISMEIFDAVKKEHKLSPRDRLLMRVICILHDCGKYISISAANECSYTIIMSSEILGLTHKERMLIASVVSTNRGKELAFEDVAGEFTPQDYMKYLKFLAILRVSNALDRSHKQKLSSIRITLKEDTLMIALEAKDSIALEKGLFDTKAKFFEEVFAIRPKIHERRK